MSLAIPCNIAARTNRIELLSALMERLKGPVTYHVFDGDSRHTRLHILSLVTLLHESRVALLHTFSIAAVGDCANRLRDLSQTKRLELPSFNI